MIPVVWSSDAHSIEDLGRRFTWVKMTRPDLEGLRLALLDGSDSIRPARGDSPGDPNTHGPMAIESITIRDAKYMGRESPLTVKFNPWLNAIIGGRGTGKSTLVDICRKTLRRDTELDGSTSDGEGSLRKQYDLRMRVPPSRNDEGLLTDKTLSKIVYRRDGQRFALSWDIKGKAHAIFRLCGDQRSKENGDVCERFPARIYSQKQLFGLAQDPNALLAVIDDSRDVRAAELNREIEQAETNYMSCRARARAAAKRAASLPDRSASLLDIRRKLDVLQSSKHSQVLTEYRRRIREDDTWNAIQDAVFHAIDAVEGSAADLTVPDLDLGTDLTDQARQGLGRVHRDVASAVTRLRRDVQAAAARARADVGEVLRGDDYQKWSEALISDTRDFDEVTDHLVGEGITGADAYSDLLQRKASLHHEVESLKGEADTAVRLEEQAVRALSEYRKARDELSCRRISFVQATSSDSVRVSVGMYANRRGLAARIGEILGVDHYERDRRELAARINKAGSKWSWKELDKMVEDLRRFQDGSTEKWPTKDGRFATVLRKIPPERIDRLALYLPGDDVTVKYRKGGGRKGKWTPLSRGSPGQQTAALLSFVLGYGDEPIILDQPEDDLDSTLIYGLLVQSLRETKIRRQVIVVTHNPNIVVHGDAECVLSLASCGDQTRIVCQGGLQERRVRDEICEVMEGGREAFERRYLKIMPQEERERR